MKKVIILCPIVLVIVAAVAGAEDIVADVSQATFEITGPSSFRIHNAFAQAPDHGIPQGRYWAEFQWDGAGHLLVPVGFGPEEPGPPPQNVNVTGYYSGYYYIAYAGYQPSMVTVTATLVQTGTNIAGSWHAANGEDGTISGGVDGSSVIINFVASNVQDSGSASGSYNNGTLSFNGTGLIFIESCGGYGYYTFNGVLTKQSEVSVFGGS